MNEELRLTCEKFRARWGDPTEELHAAYDPWLADMASRPGNLLEPIEFDLEKHPEQGIFKPKIDALDPYPKWMPDRLYYAGIDIKMVRSLGLLAYTQLLDQMRQQPVSSDDPSLLVDRLMANQRGDENGENKRNTMWVTSHINFQELGYSKALRLRAKKDRANIGSNGVLFNKLMTRQTYMGETLVDTFRPASNIYFSSPISASSERFGVPENASRIVNALFLKALKPDLAKGGLEMDAALTGKQIVRVNDENGQLDHYEIPEINPSSAELIRGFHDIVGSTIVKSPGTGKWRMGIGDVINVEELLKTNSPAEIVDSVYRDIAKSVEEFTGTDVVYRPLA